MRSVMTHQFSQVPRSDIPRSSFDRSHGYKTTFDAGYLIPVYCDEALPGDTFHMRMAAFARLATPLYPFMDNMFLDVFFFAVPQRLIWTNWKKFNGEQANPADSTSYVMPTITSTPVTGYLASSIWDYMGIPTEVPGLVHRACWARAYNLIWNEWFRDENLQNSVTVNTGDGPDLPTDYTLLKRGKRHDYFTSALPFAQKGTAVTVPLGTSATVKTTGADVIFTMGASGDRTLTGDGTNVPKFNSVAAASTLKFSATTGASGLYADLSTATAATINQLRQAFQVQRMYERDARGGTRYTEIVRSHFGVISPDARLQRPELLGTGSFPLNVHPIPQQSASAITGSTTKMGDLAAFATASTGGAGFSKSFTEHCVIIGLISARADLNYQQGLNRMWSRSTRFDFYWPALAHLGEQTVLNKELYAQGSANPTDDAATFGYQERYAEYRYKPSEITGQFRSNYATPLDAWHLAQNFASLPVLNSTFIQETPPMSRVKAVTTAPDFLLDCFFSLKCARPMPIYGVPGLIDHF